MHDLTNGFMLPSSACNFMHLTSAHAHGLPKRKQGGIVDKQKDQQIKLWMDEWH